MKQKTTFFTALMLIFLYAGVLSAQEAITAAGGEAKGDGGKFSYSVGQIAYSHLKSTSGSELQGVQQPYEISIISDVKEDDLMLEILVYPNPAEESVKLNKEISSGAIYQLCNIEGNVIFRGEIKNKEFILPMNKLESGTYILNIFTKKNKFKTFKIIKY